METVVLAHIKLGIENLVHFDFMNPLAPVTIMRVGHINSNPLPELGNNFMCNLVFTFVF